MQRRGSLEFWNIHCHEFMQSIKDIQMTLGEEIKRVCEYRPFEKCVYSSRIPNKICCKKLEYVLEQLDNLKQSVEQYTVMQPDIHKDLMGILLATTEDKKQAVAEDVFQLFAENVRDSKEPESRWALVEETRLKYFRGKDFVSLLRTMLQVS